MNELSPAPLAYPFRTFCRNAGISFGHGYNEIRAGRLKAVKSGSKTMILAKDAEAWLAGLRAFDAADAEAA